MSDSPPPCPTPSGYQRTTGGQFQWRVPSVAELQAFFTQYEIQGLLGQGGMGAVFRAHQKSLGRLVAIKVLPSGTGDDNFNFAERFKNEAAPWPGWITQILYMCMILGKRPPDCSTSSWSSSRVRTCSS